MEKSIYMINDWNGDEYETLATIKTNATAEQIKKAKSLADKTWKKTEDWLETFEQILKNENIVFEHIEITKIV